MVYYFIFCIMPDMSMCEGNNCPLKQTCYRHTAVANTTMQSYNNFTYNVEEEKCDFYWPTKILEHGKDNPGV